jgi:hypothetical protein
MSMEISDLKKLPFEERRKLTQEKIKVICNELDIDIIPVLGQTPASIVAQVLFVDLQDEEMLKRLGISKNPLMRNKVGEKLSN